MISTAHRSFQSDLLRRLPPPGTRNLIRQGPDPETAADTIIRAPVQPHGVGTALLNILEMLDFRLYHGTENLRAGKIRNWYGFCRRFPAILSGFRGPLPAVPVTLQPLKEPLGRQDPDAGGIPFAPVAALEGRTQGRGIVGEESRLQHILTVFQFQVVVVQKAAAAVPVIDVLIDQDAGVELGRQPVRERPADGMAQGGSQVTAPVVVPPRRGRTAGRVMASQPSSSSSTLAGSLLSAGLGRSFVPAAGAGGRRAATQERSWSIACSEARRASHSSRSSRMGKKDCRMIPFLICRMRARDEKPPELPSHNKWRNPGGMFAPLFQIFEKISAGRIRARLVRRRQNDRLPDILQILIEGAKCGPQNQRILECKVKAFSVNIRPRRGQRGHRSLTLNVKMESRYAVRYVLRQRFAVWRGRSTKQADHPEMSPGISTDLYLLNPEQEKICAFA